MTLQQLEYVVAVARYGHFAKAADHCQVTQPTLSAMIQKLEDELGMKIFDRRRQPIRPTAAGQEVVEQARHTLDEARKVKDKALEWRHDLSGTFNLGVIPTVAPYLVPRFFPRLMAEHPEMDVRVTEMKTSQLLQALERGDLDAAVMARVDDMDQWQCTPLFYEMFYAYVAATDQLASRDTVRTIDLRGEYLWLLDEGHCFGDQLVKFCELRSASLSKRSYNLGSIETFMRIVENGKGVTFIPELATLQLSECQRGLVRPFALPVPTREILMVTSNDFIRVSLRDVLIDFIRQSVPQEMHALRSMQQRV